MQMGDRQGVYRGGSLPKQQVKILTQKNYYYELRPMETNDR